MKLTPFWTDDAIPPLLTATAQPDQIDVAIIGSGYTGLHAAHVLAKAGANVAVFEAHSIGWGASSRNGGMVNPGLKLTVPELFHRYGHKRGEHLWQWSLDAIDFVEQFVRSEAIMCDFVRHGQVVLAYKPRHFIALSEEAKWHRQHLNDKVPQVVGPAELANEVGSSTYFGGLYDARAAGLHPAKYVVGIAQSAARTGVYLLEHTPVLSLLRDGKQFKLQTPHGTSIARTVLLATNGYTNNLVPDARRGIFAGGSYIITTAPLPNAMRQTLSPKNRMFYDTKHFLNYFRLTPDGRMLFGGRHNLTTDLPLEQSASELRRRMVEVFPQLEGIELSHSWTGKLGLTFDLMPHAGQIQTGDAAGIHYAYGYGGHGVAIASYLGHQMGKWLAGETTDNPILNIPHHRYFFTPYEKYFLPFVQTGQQSLEIELLEINGDVAIS